MTDFTTRIEENIARENKPALRHLFRLFGYVFGSTRGMCLAFLALSTLLSLLRPVLAILWGRFIDTASAFGSVTALVALLISYYLINFLAGLLERYTQSYEQIERLDVVQKNRFQETLDKRLYQKLARLPSEYYEVPKINDRIERVFQFTEDAWSGLNRDVMVRGYMIVSKAISVASIAATLYLLEPTLALIALIAPIPTLYTTFAAEKIRSRFVRDNTKTKREATYFEKLMRGPAAKEIKALRLHDFIYEKWRVRIADYSAKERKAQGTSALLELVSDLLTGSASGGATVLAIVRMTQGRLSIGGLGAAISLIGSLMEDTDQLFGAIGGFIAKKNEAAQFFDLMDLPEEATPDRHIAEIGEIRAHGVDYRYPMTEKWALKDVNLTIRKGEHVAFVGENGAGKTTFVRILTGMLSPSAGELLVNGIPAGRGEPAGSDGHSAPVAGEILHVYRRRERAVRGRGAGRKRFGGAGGSGLRRRGAGCALGKGRRRDRAFRRRMAKAVHRPGALSEPGFHRAGRADGKSGRQGGGECLRTIPCAVGRANPRHGHPPHQRRVPCQPHRGVCGWKGRRRRHTRRTDPGKRRICAAVSGAGEMVRPIKGILSSAARRIRLILRCAFITMIIRRLRCMNNQSCRHCRKINTLACKNYLNTQR